MSAPNELPEIGSTAQRLRQNPRFDPVAAGVSPEEYFVWTRFDGATTLKDLMLMTGFAMPKAVDIVRKLRTVGAILLPGEKPEAVAARLRAAMPNPVPMPAQSRPPSGPVRARSETDNELTIERGPSFPGHASVDADEDRSTTRMSSLSIRSQAPHTPAGAPAGAPAAAPAAAPAGAPAAASPNPRAARPQAAMPALTPPPRTPTAPLKAQRPLEDVDLTEEEQRKILAMHQRIQSGDPFAILGVTDESDKKAIKRAYFALSKELHPDRFYGKRTGSFGAMLDQVFAAVAQAYANLNEERARRTSPPPTSNAASHTGASSPQNPADYAIDLFDRACQAEVSGDLNGALRLFASAMRIDAPSRYLRRAARCALAAGELRASLEYAKKAANLEPNDPSTARLLAAVFKASGKLEDAEEVLVLALMIKSENDQLSREMQADLAEVRRLVAK